MAASLIGGLINQGKVKAADVYLFEPNIDRAKELANQYKLCLVDDNASLVRQCDVVIIAVKPQVLNAVLQPLAEAFTSKQPLIISVVAGIGVGSIEQWLQQQLAVVRVMPNTPALVGKGATGLFANEAVSAQQRTLTEQLMSAVGCVSWVPNESDIDTVTALSGSGPAYFMLFMQGLIEAAENAGLDSHTAKALAVQTAAGAAELVATSDLSLQTLIENITSPNGTTEQALISFNNDNFKGIIANAFKAAQTRSSELADELG